MTITNVWWNDGGYDIHLLTGGKTQPLNQKLKIERGVGGSTTTFPANSLPAGVTVKFTGEFKGLAPAHGVKSLNATTGEIEIDSTLPARRLHNFHVRAEVTESGGNTLDTRIRIHIHQSIKKIWLTPRKLTLYHGTTNQQFTVLAEFDDGTNADITGLSSLTYFNAHPTRVTVAADGKLTSLQAGVFADISVQLQPLPAPNNLISKATVFTVPSLATTRKIVRVQGNGPVDFDKKTNILFLPDGFDISERTSFTEMVDRIVKKLQTDTATFPYNELKDNINYWRLDETDFVGSLDRNVGVLAEMGIVGRKTMRGKLVPFPVKPRPSVAKWKLEHLVFMVGLPVDSDRSKSLSQKLTDWNILYDGITAPKIKDAVFKSWRAMSDRKIVNEHDTGFGLTINDHPRVDRDQDRVVSFHPRRTTFDQFKAFLDKLQLNGTVVGATWTTGKDKGLVCVISRSARIGGSQEETGFATTLGESKEDTLQAAPTGERGLDLTVMDFLTGTGKLRSLHPAVVSTVAHECAHAFGLKDEYGGGFEFPDHLAAQYSAIGNIQPRKELLLIAPLTGLDADKIRWKLPRIKAAGVLNGNPTPSGGNFKVNLVTVRAGNFAPKDVVRLRKKSFIGNPSAFSARFEIDNVTGNQITIKPLAGSTLTPADFPAGSLLIATVPGTPVPPATVGEDLSLIAPVILKHIFDKDGPLNAPKNNPTRACLQASDSTSIMTPLNLPNGLPPRRPLNKANIIGIYDGGVFHDCGIYHPAGLCIMRTLYQGSRTARFCQVCRYLIIDRVDPIKHKELDAIYAKEYPEP